MPQVIVNLPQDNAGLGEQGLLSRLVQVLPKSFLYGFLPFEQCGFEFTKGFLAETDVVPVAFAEPFCLRCRNAFDFFCRGVYHTFVCVILAYAAFAAA